MHRGGGEVPVGAEHRHRQVQDAPATGRADEHVSLRHERLLHQAEGVGAHPAPEQEGQQGGDPATCHRLHLGLAARVGRSAGAGVSASRGKHGPEPGTPRCRCEWTDSRGFLCW
ncbi:hypothetical protein scyTo_0013376 [Scyliorhinus torazame]|uniref:Uncharacterized protein n=1 Tax=Scyliorhinus torazame TaxID=75743 RepID=A0A401NV07_SCYTO|nr:hypothetical protein [Scyliorhinus torazame]